MSDTPKPIEFRRSSGQCHIYIGPMCSGKTLKINNELTMASDTGLKVLRIGHKDDIRNTASVDVENGITTHHSQFMKLSTKIKSVLVSKLSEVDPNGYHVIGIDEGQFFPDLYLQVKNWVLNLGKIVYIASLDADSNLELFGQVTKLIPIAETVTKKTARCIFCLENESGLIITPAVSTVCKVEKVGQTLVGGLESYSPACLKCWLEHNKS
uniref:Thymidine kinase n=1 Tax=Pithovirus LCPAC202 TaxID=2506592 RepID=A0A481Z6W7_9VIRU|nr:MAG: thymidine kinase [Pithovirus LCPAC202]